MICFYPIPCIIRFYYVPNFCAFPLLVLSNFLVFNLLVFEFLFIHHVFSFLVLHAILQLNFVYPCFLLLSMVPLKPLINFEFWFFFSKSKLTDPSCSYIEYEDVMFTYIISSNNPFDSFSPTPLVASLKRKDKILLEVHILFGGPT